VIILAGFAVTFISITHLYHIVWVLIDPLKRQTYDPVSIIVIFTIRSSHCI